MKNLFAVAGIAAITIGLAGCTTSAAPAPKATSVVTPAATPTPADALASFPTFEEKTFKGKGAALLALPAPAALVSYSVKGDPNYSEFSIDTLDKNNKDTGSLVNSYSDQSQKGTTTVGVIAHITGDDDGVSTRLRIKASTSWEITVRPISEVKRGMPVKGTGDDVYYVEKPTSDATVTARNAGNFTIYALNASSGEANLLVNESKKYSGIVPFENVPQFLIIGASGTGTWTIK